MTDFSQVRSHQASQESEKKNMVSFDMTQSRLRDLILQGKGFEAETLGRELGVKSDPVLESLFGDSSAKVRRSVLEVASQAKTPGSSRVILKGLDDPDSEIRDLSKYLVGTCSQPEVLPDILRAMDEHQDPALRSVLALQVGIIGSKTEIPKLHGYQKTTTDSELLQNLDLALARLGDPDARNVLIDRIHQTELMVRFRALQDCLYVQDPSLINHFQPALTDYRDAILITIPEAPQQVRARICDVAVMVMANLRCSFSFSGLNLRRFTQEELLEAQRMLPNSTPPSGQVR